MGVEEWIQESEWCLASAETFVVEQVDDTSKEWGGGTCTAYGELSKESDYLQDREAWGRGMTYRLIKPYSGEIISERTDIREATSLAGIIVIGSIVWRCVICQERRYSCLLVRWHFEGVRETTARVEAEVCVVRVGIIHGLFSSIFGRADSAIFLAK